MKFFIVALAVVSLAGEYMLQVSDQPEHHVLVEMEMEIQLVSNVFSLSFSRR